MACIYCIRGLSNTTLCIISDYEYFDDWVVVKTNEDLTEITGFLVRRDQGEDRVETIDWK